MTKSWHSIVFLIFSMLIALHSLHLFIESSDSSSSEVKQIGLQGQKQNSQHWRTLEDQIGLKFF